MTNTAHFSIVVDVYVPLLLLHCRRGILRNHYQTLFLTIMSLSAKCVSQLADALKNDVINYMYEDERYAELMHDLVSDALRAKLGDVDEDLFFEIGMCLVDRIELK